MARFATEAPDERRVWTISAFPAALVALAWSRGLHHLGWTWPWYLESLTPLAAFGLLVAWVDRIWPGLCLAGRRLSTLPDLNGTWIGAIQSSHGGETNIPITLHIHQTMTRASIRLSTATSSSQATMVGISGPDGSRPPVLRYTYDNAPRNLVDPGLHRHSGTVELELSRDGETLEGDYYTDNHRRNCGRITVKRIARHLIDTPHLPAADLPRAGGDLLKTP